MAKIKTLIITSIMAAGFNAFAFDQKAGTNIDFNKMIEANNIVREELTEDTSINSAKLPELEIGEDRENVIDFVNLEVGIGEAPPVVDRRYDSVGEIQVVNLD